MIDGIERRLFVAATNQNDGKTTCSLGFVRGFCKYAQSVGFIKPVGQRFITFDSKRVYEDALMIRQACNLSAEIEDINPISVDQHFTRQFLDDPEGMYPPLEKVIRESFSVAAKNNDLIVIEGTGHAGVGSVFGLSNAHVAKMLDAKVVIVTLGGIGRPVDDVSMNRGLFEKEGVPVLGVVVNKVMPEKLEQTRYYLSKAFHDCGLPLLGVIPNVPRLAWPTVQHVADTIHADVLNAQECMGNEIVDIIIGAMTPPNALNYVKDRTLLIVPGDRDDIVLASVTMHLVKEDVKISGIVLTGGIGLQPQTMDLVTRTNIPVLSVEMRTYDAASKIHDIIVKIRVTDAEKIEVATRLVEECVDLEQIWHLLC
jgi:BioD-like phosphotransacetylase family protein